MDWWAGMNPCVASATAITDINHIEAIIFDPWNNCDELDLGAMQQQQQQQQAGVAPPSSVNSTSGGSVAIASTGGLSDGGPDCSCTPPGQHVLVPKLEQQISHSVSSSVSSSASSASSTENLASIICHGSESTNSSEYSSSFGVGQPQTTTSPGENAASLSILCQQQHLQHHQQQHHHHHNQQPQHHHHQQHQHHNLDTELQQPSHQVEVRSRAQHQHHQPVQKVRRCRHITDYVLADEEKRLLVKEGYADFPMTCQSRPLSKSEEKILRKIRRKIRNKKSAQCSRQRKKEYVEDLERKYANVLKENEQLKDLLDQIQQHNQLNNNNNHHLPSVQSIY